MRQLTTIACGIMLAAAAVLPTRATESTTSMALTEGKSMRMGPDGHITMSDSYNDPQVDDVWQKQGSIVTEPMVVRMHNGKVMMMLDMMMSDGKRVSEHMNLMVK